MYLPPPAGHGSKPPQVPPPNYRCNKCHVPGHFIHDCPLLKKPNQLQNIVKKTTGIPRSFLEPVTADTPGAKINNQGNNIFIF